MSARGAPAAVVLAFALWAGAGAPRAAAGEDRVLVVANSASASSQRIARAYAAGRGIPTDHVLLVQTPAGATIRRAAFDRSVQAVIAAWLRRQSAQDRIHYIVLSRDLPMRIAGTTGRSGTGASVDSELALLYRRLTGAPVPLAGPVANPCFYGDGPLAAIERFSRTRCDIYLVTRLEGSSEDEAIALVERGRAPRQAAPYLLAADTAQAGVLAIVSRAASRLRELRDFPVIPTNEGNPLGGTFHVATQDEVQRLRFASGAVAAAVDVRGGRAFRAGASGRLSPISAALVQAGATGVAVDIEDPYADGVVRPEILFSARAAGLPLADAFYAAIPYVSWKTVVVGDPLSGMPLDLAPAPDGSIDEGTLLPREFASRRLAELQKISRSRAACVAAARGEALTARGDFAAARDAFRDAVAADGQFVEALVALGAALETTGDGEGALAAYARALELAPNNPVALNNLAYVTLRVRHDATAALPLAERAAKLAPQQAAVADTFGWVLHHVGRSREGAVWLKRAVDRAPDRAEIRLHAAVVFAAAGRTEAATQELRAALLLDAALASRAEVATLRQQLARDEIRAVHVAVGRPKSPSKQPMRPRPSVSPKPRGAARSSRGRNLG